MIIERKSTEKKMQSSFELQAPVCRPCLPPTIKNTPGKGWRIEYYFINPFTQATERRAICLNTFRKKCRTQSDFRVMANRLIQVLTSKLALGWTPLVESLEFGRRNTNRLAVSGIIRVRRALTKVWCSTCDDIHSKWCVEQKVIIILDNLYIGRVDDVIVV